MAESPSQHFLRIRGRVTGPHALAELEVLARRGTLLRVHEVSTDRVHWKPAGEIDAFSGFWRGSCRGAQVPVPLVAEATVGRFAVAAQDPLAAYVADRKQEPWPSQQHAAIHEKKSIAPSRLMGIVAGVLLIGVWSFPETRGPVALEWWWTGLRNRHLIHIVMSVLATPLAITVIFGACRTSRQARGWAYVIAGSLCTLLVIGLAATAWPSLGEVVALMLPVLVATIVSAVISASRSRVPADQMALAHGLSILLWICAAAAVVLLIVDAVRGGLNTAASIVALIAAGTACTTLAISAVVCWSYPLRGTRRNSVAALIAGGLLLLLFAALNASYAHAAEGGIEYAVNRFAVLRDMRAFVVLYVGALLFAAGLWELVFSAQDEEQVQRHE